MERSVLTTDDVIDFKPYTCNEKKEENVHVCTDFIRSSDLLWIAHIDVWYEYTEQIRATVVCQKYGSIRVKLYTLTDKNMCNNITSCDHHVMLTA